MRKTLTTLAAAAILASGGGIAAHAQGGDDGVRHAVIPTRPCKYEDSVNCYWDAGMIGNGKGYSYWSVIRGDKVCIHYLNARMNRRHGGCR